MDIPTASLVITGFLGILTAVGTLLAVYLTRKGKGEDVKIAEKEQAFDQLHQLAAMYKAEGTSQWEARLAERTEAEKRLDRQQARCREMTTVLVKALKEVRAHPASAEATSEHALRLLQQHREYHYGAKPESEGPADQG